MAVVIGAALWGSIGPIAALYPTGSALGLASWRQVVGSIALVLWVWLSRSGWSRWGRRDVRMTLAGIVSVAAYSLLYFPSVFLCGVATATVVSIGAAPVIAGLAHRMRGGTVSRAWLVATGIAIAGMCLVVLPGAHTSGNWLGVLLAVLAAASYALQAHTIRALVARHGSAEVVAVLFSGAAIVLAPFGLLSFGLVTSSVISVLGLVYLGVFTIAVAYALFARGLRDVSAHAAVTLSLVEPVSATVLAALIAHQIPAAAQVVGITITIGALVLLARSDSSSA